MNEFNQCPTCKHSLEDNQHGFDQNDGYMDGDKLILYGTCTYCKICNPTLFRKKEWKDASNAR